MGNVQQVATILVGIYGRGAPQEAARRSDYMLQKGDPNLSQMWLSVSEAAEAILSRLPEENPLIRQQHMAMRAVG